MAKNSEKIIWRKRENKENVCIFGKKGGITLRRICPDMISGMQEKYFFQLTRFKKMVQS